jgi:hypothetical protein
MSRRTVLISTFLFLAGLGCGSDQRDSLIINTKTQVEEAANAIAQLRAAIEKVAKEAADKKRPLSSKDFADTTQFTDKLKKAGQVLLTIKTETDLLKDPPTQEEKDRLQEKYGDGLRSALNRLETEEKELKKVVAKVKTMDMQDKALDPLETAYKQARGEFAAPAKQR